MKIDKRKKRRVRDEVREVHVAQFGSSTSRQAEMLQCAVVYCALIEWTKSPSVAYMSISLLPTRTRDGRIEMCESRGEVGIERQENAPAPAIRMTVGRKRERSPSVMSRRTLCKLGDGGFGICRSSFSGMEQTTERES
jgi:hypothetical protein